jgi:hypothetical protein
MVWLTSAMTSARSAGSIRGHGPSSNARRAAPTALSMSAALASGTRAMTSSVWGDTTSMVAEVAGATHSPPMNSLSCTCMSSPGRAVRCEWMGGWP